MSQGGFHNSFFKTLPVIQGVKKKKKLDTIYTIKHDNQIILAPDK